MDPASIWIVSGWITLHVAALAVACGTRMASGSRIEPLAQLCFFAVMAMIGTATWICQQLDAAWCWSAITLVAMVLLAIIDFRRISDPSPEALAGS